VGTYHEGMTWLPPFCLYIFLALQLHLFSSFIIITSHHLSRTLLHQDYHALHYIYASAVHIYQYDGNELLWWLQERTRTAHISSRFMVSMSSSR